VEFQPMSPDEIERTVQFLLRQQAQFAADFEKLTAKTDRLTDAVVGLTGIVGRLAEGHERLRASQERTDARLRELAEQAKRTEANLDALIDMFERHLREDHGSAPS
jgi:hypothetical protein